jgi:hypothetical protein
MAKNRLQLRMECSAGFRGENGFGASILAPVRRGPVGPTLTTCSSMARRRGSEHSPGQSGQSDFASVSMAP